MPAAVWDRSGSDRKDVRPCPCAATHTHADPKACRHSFTSALARGLWQRPPRTGSRAHVRLFQACSRRTAPAPPASGSSRRAAGSRELTQTRPSTGPSARGCGRAARHRPSGAATAPSRRRGCRRWLARQGLRAQARRAHPSAALRRAPRGRSWRSSCQKMGPRPRAVRWSSGGTPRTRGGDTRTRRATLRLTQRGSTHPTTSTRATAVAIVVVAVAEAARRLSGLQTCCQWWESTLQFPSSRHPMTRPSMAPQWCLPRKTRRPCSTPSVAAATGTRGGMPQWRTMIARNSSSSSNSHQRHRQRMWRTSTVSSTTRQWWGSGYRTFSRGTVSRSAT